MVERIIEISKIIHDSKRHTALVTRLTTKKKTLLLAELYSMRSTLTTEILKKGVNYGRLDELQMYLSEVNNYIKQINGLNK